MSSSTAPVGVALTILAAFSGAVLLTAAVSGIAGGPKAPGKLAGPDGSRNCDDRVFPYVQANCAPPRTATTLPNNPPPVAATASLPQAPARLASNEPRVSPGQPIVTNDAAPASPPTIPASSSSSASSSFPAAQGGVQAAEASAPEPPKAGGPETKADVAEAIGPEERPVLAQLGGPTLVASPVRQAAPPSVTPVQTLDVGPQLKPAGEDEQPVLAEPVATTAQPPKTVRPARKLEPIASARTNEPSVAVERAEAPARRVRVIPIDRPAASADGSADTAAATEAAAAAALAAARAPGSLPFGPWTSASEGRAGDPALGGDASAALSKEDRSGSSGLPAILAASPPAGPAKPVAPAPAMTASGSDPARVVPLASPPMEQAGLAVLAPPSAASVVSPPAHEARAAALREPLTVSSIQSPPPAIGPLLLGMPEQPVRSPAAVAAVAPKTSMDTPAPAASASTPAAPPSPAAPAVAASSLGQPTLLTTPNQPVRSQSAEAAAIPKISAATTSPAASTSAPAVPPAAPAIAASSPGQPALLTVPDQPVRSQSASAPVVPNIPATAPSAAASAPTPAGQPTAPAPVAVRDEPARPAPMAVASAGGAAEPRVVVEAPRPAIAAAPPRQPLLLTVPDAPVRPVSPTASVNPKDQVETSAPLVTPPPRIPNVEDNRAAPPAVADRKPSRDELRAAERARREALKAERAERSARERAERIRAAEDSRRARLDRLARRAPEPRYSRRGYGEWVYPDAPVRTRTWEERRSYVVSDDPPPPGRTYYLRRPAEGRRVGSGILGWLGGSD